MDIDKPCDGPDQAIRTTSGVVEETLPLVLTAAQAAAWCGKSLRTWRRWNSAGLVPNAICVGRSMFWHKDELRAWINAGCPRRDVWDSHLRK